MTDNLSIWSQLAKSDPKHTKKFTRAGGFSGTSLKPIWMTHRMTEIFGPCGTGWGMTKPEFQTVPAGEEVLVYCTVGLWYGDGANIVYGVGGDKAVGKNRNGIFADDEAFKKSYTDALSNAMKQIGMAADIHMGQHDDDKYVTALKEEFREDSGPVKQANFPTVPVKNGGDGPDWQAFVTQFVGYVASAPDNAWINGFVKSHKAALDNLKTADATLFASVQKATQDRRADIGNPQEKAA